MFKVFIVAIISLVILACNNHNPQSSVNNTPSTDAVTHPEKIQDTLAALKNITINEAYYEQKVKQTKKLSDTLVQSLLLTDIEDINRQPETPVKIIDTLWHTDTESMIIVALDGETETSAYIVHLKNNRLQQFEEVYYADVVEYFMQINTTIHNNTLDIHKTTDGDGKTTKETVSFLFKEGRLQKVI